MKAKVTDGAGVAGAVLAALCCAGNPLLLSAMVAVGLGFLRRDSILLPLMFVSLVVALFGFWQGWKLHRLAGPIAVGSIGGISMSAGVTVVHGFPAMQMIYGGAILLIAAVVWNIRARASCEA